MPPATIHQSMACGVCRATFCGGNMGKLKKVKRETRATREPKEITPLFRRLCIPMLANHLVPVYRCDWQTSTSPVPPTSLGMSLFSFSWSPSSSVLQGICIWFHGECNVAASCWNCPNDIPIYNVWLPYLLLS